MLAPREIDRQLHAVLDRMRARTGTPAHPLATARPIPARQNPGLPKLGRSPAASRAPQSIGTTYGAGTGINHWWRYQEYQVPGAGHVMVNVGTGNYLIQADDVIVANKGLALAYRRTYNSQSGHDVNGSDGSAPSMYGNGWTATWDAHLSGDQHNIAVWDIDGTRYDYTLAADNVSWIPLGTNQHATFTSDGACGFFWTKKSGVTYYFFKLAQDAQCQGSVAQYGGYAGRLHQIIGRNRNTWLSFNYAWDSGNAGPSGKISSITVSTESGAAATLTLADFNGHRLVGWLTRPDGSIVSYGYDAAGNGDLASVGFPPSSGTDRVYEGYSYGVSSNQARYIAAVSSPNWNAAGGAAGAYLFFNVQPAGNTTALSAIGHVGFVNPRIADDGYSNDVLQPTASRGVSTYRVDYFVTNSMTPSFSDTNGHMTNWVLDAALRPLQTQECTSSTNQGQQCQSWLTMHEAWDQYNDPISETDARGNQMNFAYDTQGNLIARAEPSTVTSSGTFRPTKLYDYDANNNITAYCDEAQTHAAHADWASAPSSSDSLCSSAANAAGVPYTRITYVKPPEELSGEISTIVSPLGYTKRVSYNLAPQGGTNYGLPTEIVSDQILQNDGTVRVPSHSYAYDAAGDITCSTAIGGDQTTISVLTYDIMGRVVAFGDADDASVPSTNCTKTPGIASSTVATVRTYFPDGRLASERTPAGAAAGHTTNYTYDADGNRRTETHWHNNIGSTTTKWYDGADRLIEVQLPPDANDLWPFPWTTRYIYDLTQGQTNSISSSSFKSYGNLAKTQELLPPGTVFTWSETQPPGSPTPQWTDISANETDGLDRSTTLFRSTGATLQAATQSYDGTPDSLGKMTSRCNAASECMTYQYDERYLVKRATSSLANTPTRQYAYDEDARMVAVSSANGAITELFDFDGRKTQRTQNVPGVANPSTLLYHYYQDGLRSAVDIQSSSNYPSALSYSYRADGALQTLTALGSYSWKFTYTGAGRQLTRQDPATATSTATATVQGSQGRPASWSNPVGGARSLTYDGEGSLLSQTTVGPWFNGTDGSVLSATYTSRGELVSETYPQYPVPQFKMANGVRANIGQSTKVPNTASFSFNPLQGLTAATSTRNTALMQNNLAVEYAYDGAGRLAGSSAQQFGQTCDRIDGCVPTETDGSTTKSYDAEDHLLSDVYSNVAFPKEAASRADPTSNWALAYLWGPTSHPFKIGGAMDATSAAGVTQLDALYWDDDTLLFTQNPAGAVNDIKIGSFADFVPGGPGGGLTIWDRDSNGQLIGCHNATGVGSIVSNVMQKLRVQCTGANGFVAPAIAPKVFVGKGGLLVAQHTDGWGDGFNTFQGTRTYSNDVGTWTTPDPFRGVFENPTSQKPYVWDGNNPYSYSDPIGWSSDETVNRAYNALMRIYQGSNVGFVVDRYFRNEGDLDRIKTGVLRAFDLIYAANVQLEAGVRTPWLGNVHLYVQADKLGELWVGPGAHRYEMENGNRALVSVDGQRQFRSPEYKKGQSEVQANFEIGVTNSRGTFEGNVNAHLNVNPNQPISFADSFANSSFSMTNGYMMGTFGDQSGPEFVGAYNALQTPI